MNSTVKQILIWVFMITCLIFLWQFVVKNTGAGQDKSISLTQLLNDLAWVTLTCGVPFLVAQCGFLALAVAFDHQDQPVFPRWVGRFNVVVALALIPAAFAGLTETGMFAWDGVVSFWVKNVAIALWIIVMATVLGRAVERDAAAAEALA